MHQKQGRRGRQRDAGRGYRQVEAGRATVIQTAIKRIFKDTFIYSKKLLIY